MTVLEYIWSAFCDSLVGHLLLALYLFLIMNERPVWRKLKKLPLLLLSPVLAALVSCWGYAIVPLPGLVRYSVSSLVIMLLCTVWMMWVWDTDFWRAFSAVCVAGTLQVATSALISFVFLPFLLDTPLQYGVRTGAGVLACGLVVFLLNRFRFGACFKLLLEDAFGPRQTALLTFCLELSMEAFLLLRGGIVSGDSGALYLGIYAVLAVVFVPLSIGQIIYLAWRFDAGRRLLVQRDMIDRQRLYEQELEDIRREVRTFRHDYKNLLAGLSGQANGGAAEEELRKSLEQLDAGLEQRLGAKIKFSAWIGNIQIPQVRSLLLNKIAIMRDKGVECRLEALYPVDRVAMDVWDFVRCFGILADNAIEAAEETEAPWVEIVILQQNDTLNFRISNPYNNSVPSAKIWQEGWSSKGEGRGLGLFSYQRILERYSNASSSASWNDHIFVQELMITGGML